MVFTSAVYGIGTDVEVIAKDGGGGLGWQNGQLADAFPMIW